MLKIENYRNLLTVDRLQGHFKFRNYNLAEHQYMTAMIFQILCKEEHVDYNLDVLNLILQHDMVETITVDLPYPLKNFNNVTKECWVKIEKEVCSGTDFEQFSDENLKSGMSDDQYRIFKIADLLDLWIFVIEEIRIGNNSPKILDVKQTCERLLYNKSLHVDIFMRHFENNFNTKI